ncbi:MAG: hypothetical protein Fur0042_00590 [Cyanophyceae cyanobacterium]
MSYCLNPRCNERQNTDDAQFCQGCGESLLLRGHYRVLRPLGRGGFGRTFLAVDRDRLDTPCAIKQFSPRAKTRPALRKSIQLFTQEALRLRDLGEHPQIPSLLGYFEEGGRLYLVQEFVAGPNVQQEFQRQGTFSEAQVVGMLRDLLPVLQYIHDNRVIHRDLKPDNIIRRKRDGRYIPIDFGVAKQLQTGSSGSDQPGTRIGTEGYAPVEQIRHGQAFPASDLYSVGAICVFLLSGVHPDELYNPLTGKWPWREQLAQWEGAIASPETSASEWGQIMPIQHRVSEGFGQILDRLLVQAVGDRYQSADAVLADLDRLYSPTPGALHESPYLQPVRVLGEAERARRKNFPVPLTHFSGLEEGSGAGKGA